MSTFFGSFNANVSLMGFLLQLFVTSRVMRFMGVGGALFVLPLIALMSYSILAVAPVLAIVRVVKTLENRTDYSVQNTVKQALLLPTSREAKYKAKAAIDTFFMRFGDVVAAGIVGYSRHRARRRPSPGSTSPCPVWLWVAGHIAREHRKRTV